MSATEIVQVQYCTVCILVNALYISVSVIRTATGNMRTEGDRDAAIPEPL